MPSQQRETFLVTLKRDSISLSGMEADAIRTDMEIWADPITILT